MIVEEPFPENRARARRDPLAALKLGQRVSSNAELGYTRGRGRDVGHAERRDREQQSEAESSLKHFPALCAFAAVLTNPISRLVPSSASANALPPARALADGLRIRLPPNCPSSLALSPGYFDTLVCNICFPWNPYPNAPVSNIRRHAPAPLNSA